MSDIKIDKGIERPAIQSGNPRQTKYPFRSMEVGDSFFSPGDKVKGRTINAGNQWAKRNRNGHRYSGRTVTENGVRGLRVWRVA